MMKFKYIVLLMGLFLVALLSLKAYANANCDQQNTSNLKFETPQSKQVEGITICYRIKIGEGNQEFTIKLKVNIGIFNLYLARGINVTTLNDTEDQQNSSPLVASNGFSSFIFRNTKAGFYTLAIKPLINTRSIYTIEVNTPGSLTGKLFPFKNLPIFPDPEQDRPIYPTIILKDMQIESDFGSSIIFPFQISFQFSYLNLSELVTLPPVSFPIDRIVTPPLALATIELGRGKINGLAGYFVPTDTSNHLICANNMTGLQEIWFLQDKQSGYTTLTTLNAIALAGYYTPNDQYQHVIAATADGNLTEMYFKGDGQGVGTDVLGNLEHRIVSIAGYYSENDAYQHVIAATDDGNLHEFYFRSGQGVGHDILAQFSGITAIAGYYASEDGNQHVMVATSDGKLHEVYFKGGQGVGQDEFATVGSVVGLAGYYADSDNYQHVIVATADGIIEFYFRGGQGVNSGVLASLKGIESIAGFYSAGDGYQHVFAATSDGNIHEYYFKGNGQGINHYILAHANPNP